MFRTLWLFLLFTAIASAILCESCTSFMLRFFPLEMTGGKRDGNMVSLANKSSAKRILFVAWQHKPAGHFDNYGCCDAGFLENYCELYEKDDIPVEDILYQWVNTWDTVYVVKDDTIRLFYSCNHLTHKGDSIHDIYNIDSWERDFYVNGNDTFDILRFSFRDEDFLRPDTIAIPYRYLVEKTKGESRWFRN